MKKITKARDLRKNMLNMLIKWSFLVLAVLSVSLVAGCRMFTID